MSLAATQPWIQSHIQPLPAIPIYAQQARLEIAKKDLDKSKLSAIIAADPGLSTQLFNRLNAKRKGTKRDYIESIQSALSLMGDAGIIHFINEMTTLDDIRSSFDCENNYLQLVARSQQAAKHATVWGEKRKSQGIKEIAIATKLYDIAQFALCLFDHEHFIQFKQKNCVTYNPDESCQKIFGFSLNDLSLALTDYFHLPDLISEAHNLKEVTGVRSQGIKIASELMHQADISWYQDKTIAYLKEAANLCQTPIDKIATLAHLSCIESVRELDFKVDFHSAVNLVQHQAPARPKTQTLTSTAKDKTSDLITPPPLTQSIAPSSPDIQSLMLNELKNIARNPATTQANQINALLVACHKYLKFKRNALFLLNQERSQLTTRLHQGLTKDSALLKFSVEKERSGLLKILLQKPQAIRINPKNFRQYEKLLPGIFKTCILSDDFFMMSLFSGKKAIGIVFCDHYGSEKHLLKSEFELFKNAVGLTAKAMLIISQRKNTDT